MTKYSTLFLLLAFLLIATGCTSRWTNFGSNQPEATPKITSDTQPGVVTNFDLEVDDTTMTEPIAAPPLMVDIDGVPVDINAADITGFTQVTLKTNYGDIVLGFYPDKAPVTVNNFMRLSQAGFYNGVKFHRVIPDFMIQSGDPNSRDNDWSNDGQGGPGYKFQDEINDMPLVRGSLAMANSGANTNGSQFFIVTASSTPWLDGLHTNFGEVIMGLDVVDKIAQVKTNADDHPVVDVIIESVVVE